MSATALQIGKSIHSILTADETVAGYVGAKVFPIVSKEGTTYPFIVYRRGGIEPFYTKDGLSGERVAVDIVIAATSYSDSVDIAEAVRESLETSAYAQLYAADEEFFEDGNVYTQTLTFNFNV